MELLAEIDRKIDDGKPFSGTFQFSEYTPPGATMPFAVTCTTADSWNIQTGETNCGPASLF